MRKFAVVALTALTAILWDCVSHDAFAGEIGTHKCGRYDRCNFSVGCPSGLCSSIYGRYGPYGGPSYWGRYTYAGWPYR